MCSKKIYKSNCPQHVCKWRGTAQYGHAQCSYIEFGRARHGRAVCCCEWCGFVRCERARRCYTWRGREQNGRAVLLWIVTACTAWRERSYCTLCERARYGCARVDAVHGVSLNNMDVQGVAIHSVGVHGAAWPKTVLLYMAWALALYCCTWRRQKQHEFTGSSHSWASLSKI
jgi:hypothetical protein